MENQPPETKQKTSSRNTFADPHESARKGAIKSAEVRRENRKRRQNVAELLASMNYDPIVEMVNMVRNEDTPAKVQADIHKELASYVYVKPKHTIQAESNANALSVFIASLSQTGRPSAPTMVEATIIETLPSPDRPKDDDE